MGEKESDKPAQVNLEMPSFGLRRKKKSRGEAEEPAAAEPAAPEAEQPEAAAAEVAPEVTAPAEVAPSAEATPAPAPVASPEPEPVTPDPTPTSRFAPPTAAEAPAEVAATPVSAPEPVREPVVEPAPVRPAAAATPTTGDGALADDLETETDPADEAPAKKQLKVQLPEFRAPRLPVIPTMTASAITGVVVGLLACVGTYAGLRGCEAIKKTDSCGGPGLLLVLAILALMVVAGTWLLKLFAVRDAGSVSFMAVGMLSMLVLAVLIPWIFAWFMLIVVPVLGAGCYMLAHYVTALFDED